MSEGRCGGHYLLMVSQLTIRLMPIIRGKHRAQLQQETKGNAHSPYLEDGFVEAGQDGDGGSLQGESPLEVGRVLLQGDAASVELR